MAARYRRMDFNLIEMLTMRYEGKSTVDIGAKFGKDHTTISHHCQKHGVSPGIIGNLADMNFILCMTEQFNSRLEMRAHVKGSKRRSAGNAVPRVLPQMPVTVQRANHDKYADIYDPPMAKGKMYKEYMAIEKARPRPPKRILKPILGGATLSRAQKRFLYKAVP